MTTQSAPPAFPHIGEIVEFLIRHFSVVHGHCQHNLKKRLDRMKKDPLPVDTSLDLIRSQMDDLFVASNRKREMIAQVEQGLRVYCDFCLGISANSLPPQAVRRVFDQIGITFFTHQLARPAFKFGVSIEQIFGNPDHAIKVLWDAYTKGKSIAEVARDLDGKPGLARGEENWKKSIRRWLGGNGMDVATILDITNHGDFDFGYSLLLANAYQDYCHFDCVDPRYHRPIYSVDPGLIQEELDALCVKKYAQLHTVRKETQELIDVLDELLKRYRIKEEGDAAQAKALIEELNNKLKGDPKLDGLGYVFGHYHIQMGQLDEALVVLEEACTRFVGRDGRLLKKPLTDLLLVASLLGKKRVLSKWGKIAGSLGIKIDIPAPREALEMRFSFPFPEAQPLPTNPQTDEDVRKEWLKKRPNTEDLDHVFPASPIGRAPQLVVFADVGRSDVVAELLAEGADPTRISKDGNSALLAAIRKGNESCVELLLPLASKKLVNSANQEGETVLFWAIWRKRPDWVSVLLRLGADPKSLGPDGSPLICTAISLFTPPHMLLEALSHPKMMENAVRLIPANQRASYSPFLSKQISTEAWRIWDPAFIEGLTQHSEYDEMCGREIVSALVTSGTDINAAWGDQKWTPLLWAAYLGHVWSIESLLKRGANTRAELSNGMTAYSLLILGGNDLLAKWLFWSVSDGDRQYFTENLSESASNSP